MALGLKMDQKKYQIYTLLGDGELSEGSVWEAAMTASKYELENLTAIIDRNRLQITGSTEEVNPVEPLKDKFLSFGFNVIEVKGNDIDSLIEVFKNPKKIKIGKPNYCKYYKRCWYKFYGKSGFMASQSSLPNLNMT